LGRVVGSSGWALSSATYRTPRAAKDRQHVVGVGHHVEERLLRLPRRRRDGRPAADVDARPRVGADDDALVPKDAVAHGGTELVAELVAVSVRDASQNEGVEVVGDATQRRARLVRAPQAPPVMSHGWSVGVSDFSCQSGARRREDVVSAVL